jgi:hypothetical protein
VAGILPASSILVRRGATGDLPTANVVAGDYFFPFTTNCGALISEKGMRAERAGRTSLAAPRRRDVSAENDRAKRPRIPAEPC